MNVFPIDSVLPEIAEALASRANLVLSAPPGAGKTTRVPPALLSSSWAQHGRIILLQPRRLAARAAAQRMAELLGEGNRRPEREDQRDQNEEKDGMGAPDLGAGVNAKTLSCWEHSGPPVWRKRTTPSEIAFLR